MLLGTVLNQSTSCSEMCINHYWNVPILMVHFFGTERTMHHMVKMAYARVSAKDRNPERQLLKFRELGIEERFTFIDKQSGKYFNRIRYNAMRLMLREGDLLYLYALDRLCQDIMAFCTSGNILPLS